VQTGRIYAVIVGNEYERAVIHEMSISFQGRREKRLDDDVSLKIYWY
jgi:hypothetical protein